MSELCHKHRLTVIWIENRGDDPWQLPESDTCFVRQVGESLEELRARILRSVRGRRKIPKVAKRGIARGRSKK